ncbi:hypothetical protein V6N12_019261 [Hibiscus sabdariffa]|uniref:Uncharacterized protein n=1 Tax=Hibiscus sabdariffa TaxID=183260 RepID=A0ABR2C717_9ROSI
MRSLCSFFDVKKQGKPVWEVRTRYWKLREGENRLSVLLEGIPITSLVEARRQEDQDLRFLKHDFELLVDGCISMLDLLLDGCMPICLILCISGLEYRNQHYGIGTRFLSGICVSILPYRYRYDSRVVSVLIHCTGTGSLNSVYGVLYSMILYGLVPELAIPRRGVRGGGQAPVHLDEVDIEQANEETLPPLPPVGGEANEGGVGP